MASEKTRAQYLISGMAFLTLARQRFGGMSDIEALCAHAEARTQTLKPATVNLFRQQYHAALAKLVEAERQSVMLDTHQRRIDDALARVRGRPAVPNTATKKVKNAKDWMVKEVFGHLKLAAIRHDRLRSAATALYCMLQPRLGTRPIELQDAHLEADVLIVRNAKRGNESSRRLDLSDFHPSHRMALWILLEIIRTDVGVIGYSRWLKILAENLARACISASAEDNRIPRLAPSSFRHTAISTWAAAGYTVEEIAEMAGHLSLFSARRHYIHAGSAWALRPGELVHLATPDDPMATDGAPTAEFLIEMDDFPAPKSPPISSSGIADGNQLWAEYRAKLDQAHHRSHDASSGTEDVSFPHRRQI